MSINRTESAPSITAGQTQQDLRVSAKNRDHDRTASPGRADFGTRVTIGSLSHKIQTDSSQDIDTGRVAQIKAAMDAGTLEFDYDKIADALVRNIFSFNN
ncbi:hypothetical protein VL10_09220 [Leclercia adecarboxylata]|nr:hypothetical protein VL10_09220 [Leclercia adecarboxylata]KMN61781.1 hypothetical protein VK95_22890 [Leclercia sp. LK8]